MKGCVGLVQTLTAGGQERAGLLVHRLCVGSARRDCTSGRSNCLTKQLPHCWVNRRRLWNIRSTLDRQHRQQTVTVELATTEIF